MKTINIRTDGAILDVPIMIPFQGAPGDTFENGEEILIQLMSNEGLKVGAPQIRSVVKTHDADENNSAWYEAYIPFRKP